MYNLSHLYERGLGVTTDKEKSLFYLKEAAKNGHAEACLKYGLILFQGLGIEANKNEGIKYIHQAAQKGDQQALIVYNNLTNGLDMKYNMINI